MLVRIAESAAQSQKFVSSGPFRFFSVAPGSLKQASAHAPRYFVKPTSQGQSSWLELLTGHRCNSFML